MTADWAMVIITAIYVGATIIIMVANRSAAKAAKEQLEEMKKEHDENTRIQVMPYLRFQVGDHLPIKNKMLPSFTININEYDGNEDCVADMNAIEVTNIGQGLATNLFCSWDHIEHIQSLPVDYLRCDESECDSFLFLAKRGTSSGIHTTFVLTFHFQDVLGHSYTQDLTINALAKENGLAITMLTAGTPVLEETF